MDQKADLSGFYKDGNVDSQGQFRVDIEVAREKLRSFQEALPAFSVLRVIQGLVASGAGEIAVRLSTDQVEVRSDSLLPLSEVREAYFQDAGLSQSPAGMVAAGLNAAQCDPRVPVWMSAHQQSWDPRADESSDCSEPGFRFVQGLGKRSGWRYLIGNRGKFYTELLKRCRFLPCRFILDGREIEPDLEPRVGSDGDGTATVASGLDWLEPGTGFKFVVGDLSPYRWEDGVFVWDRRLPKPLERNRFCYFPSLLYAGLPVDFDQSTARCRTVLSLFEVNRPLQGTVSFLRHGVICESIEDPRLLPSSVVLVDVTPLETDLSGLKIIRNQAYEERFGEVLNMMVRGVELIQHHHPSLMKAYLESAVPSYMFRTDNLLLSTLRTGAGKFLGWAASRKTTKNSLQEIDRQLQEWKEKTLQTLL